MRQKRTCFVLILTVLLSLGGCQRSDHEETKKLNVATSFYPIYISVLNITEGCPDIAVTNLTDSSTGCLHDYALTTANLKAISKCDAFVINGAGMEPFMDKVIQNTPNLKIIDASHGIQTITENGEENPHVWLSFENLFIQIDNITANLSQLSPEHAEKFIQNAEAYKQKLTVLREQMKEELAPFRGDKIITFHEAFSYFAREFGLEVVATIRHDEHSAPSPNDISNTIALIKKDHIRALFTEPQYQDSSVKTIAEETGIRVFSLDPVVTGKADESAKNAYFIAMQNNVKAIKAALIKS